MQNETIELGGNIKLTGFSDMDKGQMVVLKKIIGNYARRFSDRSETFGGLSITIKAVNETEAGAVYEICATLMDGEKQKDADCKETNIFIAVDSVLKKIEND